MVSLLSKRLIVAALSVLTLPSPAPAQTGGSSEPDVSQANVHLGRVMVKPTIALSNIGIDTNVFNVADQASPKRDFTLTLTPQTDVWLRMGRSWVSSHVREDLVWYQTFASERSANETATIGWLMPFNRLVFNANADYLNTHDRPGFEISARLQRSELAYHGSGEFRAGSRTFIGVHGERQTIKFDSVATFDGISLREALNRTVSGAGVTVRYQLTPLTGIALDVG